MAKIKIKNNIIHFIKTQNNGQGVTHQELSKHVNMTVFYGIYKNGDGVLMMDGLLFKIKPNISNNKKSLLCR